MSTSASVSSIAVVRDLVDGTYSSPEEVASAVCRAVCDALGVDAAYVTRISGDLVEVVAVEDRAGLGLRTGQRVPLAGTLCGAALDGHAPRVTSDLPACTGPDITLPVAGDLASYAMVPLEDHSGRRFGTLCLIDRFALDHDDEAEQLLGLLGGILSRNEELEQARELQASVADDLRRQAGELQVSEARHRALLDDISDIVVQLGPDGNVQFVNRAWTEVSGVPVTSVVGGSSMDRVHPDDRLLAAEHMQALALGVEDGTQREVRFLGRGGEYRWMVVKGRATLGPDGDVVGFTGMLQDITDRRRAQEQVQAALIEAEQARDQAQVALAAAERASRAKSEFLSRMSHELRTPLNAILGFGQLLELSELTGEDAEHVGLIVRAGQHLLSLINEVLDVVRIEAGRLSVSLEPVSVGEVVAASAELVRTAAGDRGLTLVNPARSCAAHVVADQQRLTQVLVNLLSNAVKYNRPAGSICVTADARTADADDEAAPFGWLRISVTDTGMGIPAPRLPDAFLPFERLGAEQTEIEGSGIGLSLSRTLVDAMGGRLGAESIVGTGSTFWVELPLAGPPPVDELPPPATEPAPSEHCCSVLYVEDNPSNIRLIERVLARLPHIGLRVAQDGAQGLQLAASSPPDLVLLGLHLPSMSGEQILAQLRQSPESVLRDLPVVVVTADLTTGTERRLMAAGATAFVSKPIDVRRMLAVVEQHLPQHVHSSPTAVHAPDRRTP